MWKKIIEKSFDSIENIQSEMAHFNKGTKNETSTQPQQQQHQAIAAAYISRGFNVETNERKEKKCYANRFDFNFVNQRWKMNAFSVWL